jgi:hypothetical protein
MEIIILSTQSTPEAEVLQNPSDVQGYKLLNMRDPYQTVGYVMVIRHL